MDKFWMVLRDCSSGFSHKRHETKDIAMAEAIRLSSKEQARFYVLEVIAFVEPQATPVKVTELT